MNTITDQKYFKRIEQAVKEKGYEFIPAVLSFEFGKLILRDKGGNPSGFYAVLGVPAPEDPKLLNENICLGPNDVIVVMGTTIQKSRYFSYVLYQHSFYDEEWEKRVETNSSICKGLNNLTLRTANGQKSALNAPFVILMGSSAEDRDAIAQILEENIDKQLLTGIDNINRFNIPPEFSNSDDELNFVHRLTFINQEYGVETDEDKIKEMGRQYMAGTPFTAFIAKRPGTAQYPGKSRDELISMRDFTAEDLKKSFSKDYRVEEYKEHQAMSFPELSRLLKLDYWYDSTDALYKLPTKGDLISQASTMKKIVKQKAKKEPVVICELNPLLNLGKEDFLLVVGINYTELDRVVYLSYACYDKNYSMRNYAGVSDNNFRGTTPEKEIYAFALSPNDIVEGDIKKLLSSYSEGKYAKIYVKTAELYQSKFFMAGRVYVDKITLDRPSLKDIAPSKVFIFRKRRRAKNSSK